ncbi:hypothetical protein Zmor_002279 [Zophobas morio]|uniref:Uncharacterized protein n=1 Tax=Zophobas morio TaxID=2755281 RepID=A0AA38MTF3_9CUCU|nr:hypothetical protein Zmor_002279 [Zophobas morio]
MTTSLNSTVQFPKKQAIVLNVINGIRRPYAVAVEEIVHPKNILFASRIAYNKICIYVLCLNSNITDSIVLVRNKAIRRPGMTPIGFLVCAAMMGDSSSVTAAGRPSHKDKSGAGYREFRLRGPEKPRSGVREPSREMYGFK